MSEMSETLKEMAATTEGQTVSNAVPVAKDATQGMVLVPREPTEAMIAAAFRQHVFDPPVGPIHNHRHVIAGIYRAMLDAAIRAGEEKS